MKKTELRKLGRTLKESSANTRLSDAIAKVRADILVLDGLLKEAKRAGLLGEESIQERTPEEVWAEGKDTAATFIANAVYGVKKLEGGEKYEVTIVDGNQRQTFATLTKQALDQSFTQIRPNEKPDAEGYLQYRKVDEVEAFKYTGDTVKVNSVLLTNGDYLIRIPKDNEFVYEIKKAKNFEVLYTQK